MNRHGILIGFLVLLLTVIGARGEEPPRSRTFFLTYEAAITELAPGTTVRIWLPVPPSDGDQQVTLYEEHRPGNGSSGKETTYGNTVLYVEAKAGEDGRVECSRRYKVTRRQVLEDTKTELTREEVNLYLKPNATVPLDGKPLTLLAGKELPEPPVERGRALFDVVNGHMRYSKEGTGWGRGDAVWACEKGYGNCTDFHSLFMSLARAKNLPTRFEIGFALPEKRGEGEVTGYHCWAKFSPGGKGWVPVDISEANKDPKHKDDYFGRLTPDRVMFSTGRDLVLVPKQDGPPINFFVYPYAEVDGKPWPAEKITLRCRYEDWAGNK